MRRRILISMILLSSLSVIFTSLIITAIGYSDYFDSVTRDVKKDSAYLKDGYDLSGETFIESITPLSSQRITLIDQTGDVLYDSEANPLKMSNHIDRPEIQTALTSGQGEDTRTSNTLREKTYYYAVQLSDGKILRLSHTTSSIFSYYLQFLGMVLVITCCVVIITIFIGTYLTKKVVQPINSIDLNHPSQSVIYEELTPLVSRIVEQNKQIHSQISALNQRQTEFETLTNSMSEGFILLDKAATILSYNQSSLSMLSVGFDITPNTTLVEINRSTSLQEATRLALDGSHQELILELNNHSYQLFLNPVVVNDETMGAVILIMDITEKQERDKLRREFTANVSHELKTPLTSISGYAEVLTSGTVDPKMVPEFSGYIYSETQRLILLVKDLMLLSKLEENSVPVKEKIDLYDISQSVINRLKPKADKKAIQISLSGNQAEISGISSVIEEMLYNLTDNAIKYNKVNGKVSIDIKQSEESITLSVADTGDGIPLSDQDRIFERFYRVDKSHNGEIEGSGLGLAIVKHAAALHNARIQVESNNKGSIFSLKFPSLSHI